MENLKENLRKTLVVFGAITVLLSAPLAGAGERGPGDGADIEGRPTQTQARDAVVETGKIGAETKAEAIVKATYGVRSGQSLSGRVNEVKSQLARLEKAARNTRSDADADNSQFFTEAGNAASSLCGAFSTQAAECCGDPESTNCSSGFGAKIKKAGPIIELVSVAASFLGGGSEGALTCLKALPKIADGLSQVMGVGKACRLLNTGGLVKDGGGSTKVMGAVQICAKVASHIRNAKVANSNESFQKNQLLKQITEHTKLVGAKLKTDERKANTQASGIANAGNGLLGCAANLLNGDEADDSFANRSVDCGNFSDAASNPGECDGFGFGSNDGGVFSKTSGFDSGSGETSRDLADDPEDEDSPENFGTPRAPANSQKTTSNPSGVGGGSGSNGAQQKAGGGGGGSPKAKNLIAGYKASKSGGSGGSRGFRGSSFRGFGNKFKNKSKKKGIDKRALAALSKLVKAGISPDQSGSIFERVTKRLSSTSKEMNLLDYRVNKKLWMEK